MFIYILALEIEYEGTYREEYFLDKAKAEKALAEKEAAHSSTYDVGYWTLTTRPIQE